LLLAHLFCVMRPTPARDAHAYRSIASRPATWVVLVPLDSIEALLNDMATVQARGTLPQCVRCEGKLVAALLGICCCRARFSGNVVSLNPIPPRPNHVFGTPQVGCSAARITT
jgi:hypothetical protein